MGELRCALAVLPVGEGTIDEARLDPLPAGERTASAAKPGEGPFDEGKERATPTSPFPHPPAADGGGDLSPEGRGRVRAGSPGQERVLESLEVARQVGLGDFSEIMPLDPAGEDALAAFRAAVEAAEAESFDWLLLVSEDETLSPDIFVKMAPALRVHDAVWGGAALAGAGTPAGGTPKVERITRLAAQDLPTFFHAALAWWIGPSHFVRPAAARAALDAAAMPAWRADLWLGLWKGARAYKTAQCMTVFHAPLPPLAETDRARLVAALEAEPAFMPIRAGAATPKLPYTGLNPVIEREQMRGLFFEAEELDYLAERLPRGMRILDVGANTGNHTLFFATIMQAASVTPIEPHPRSIAAIRAVVAANGLTNVDLSCLGRAVGAEHGTLRAVPSVTAGLGATHFVPDPQGGVPLAPLDSLAPGPVDFIKIDVEGMEMAALAGAAGLIARNRPFLYVEVLDATVGPFMAWVDSNAYRVEKLFPDKTHCNYLLVPS